jgi:hypothetical protein
VNVAARLEQAACPGEILIGAPTYALVRDAVEVEPVAPLAAKGKAAHRGISPNPVDQAAPGKARRLDLPLVGRVDELALLREAYDSTVQGFRLSPFTLLGAAGVGKSRLTRAFLQKIDRRRESRPAAASRTEMESHSSPLVEILGQLGTLRRSRCGESSTVTAHPKTSSSEMSEARLNERQQQNRPLVAVLDDVAMGDPLLVELFETSCDARAASQF